MEINELLWFIFIDELVAGLLVPFSEKYVLKAGLIFRGVESNFFVFGCLGAFIGCSINYMLGNSVSYMVNLKEIKDKKITIGLCCFLVFIPVNFFGTIATFLCGVARVELKRFFILSLLVNILYFIAYYLFKSI